MIRQIRIPLDHSHLIGVLHTPNVSKKIVCIFMHGYGSFKDESGYLYSIIAKELDGVDSVLFDYYGCGDSPGEFVDLTIDDMLDNAKKVIEFVRCFYPTYRMVLITKGISTVLAFEITRNYKIDGLICIGELQDITFPKDGLNHRLMQQWEKEGSIYLEDLLTHTQVLDKAKISAWLETLGAWDTNLLSEKINYKLIDDLNQYRLRYDELKSPSARTLWFISDDQYKRKDPHVQWIVLNRGHNRDPFRCPQIVQTMVKHIHDWLDLYKLNAGFIES